MRLDARIPVVLVTQGNEPAPASATVLIRVGPVGTAPSGWAAVRDVPEEGIATHQPADCTCGVCAGRSALGSALGVLFAQRAKAELGLFDRVVLSVPPGHDVACISVLRNDPLVAGRYQYNLETSLAFK